MPSSAKLVDWRVGVAVVLLLGIAQGPRLVDASFLRWLDNVMPAPAATDLARAVPPQARPTVGAFFSDLAAVVERDRTIRSTDALRDGYRAALAIMQRGEWFPAEGLADFDREVSVRITAALGLETGELTDDKRAKFVAVCREVAEELGIE